MYLVRILQKYRALTRIVIKNNSFLSASLQPVQLFKIQIHLEIVLRKLNVSLTSTTSFENLFHKIEHSSNQGNVFPKERNF